MTGNDLVNGQSNGQLNGTLNEKQKDVPDFRTASPGVQAKLETRTFGAVSAKKNLFELCQVVTIVMVRSNIN